MPTEKTLTSAVITIVEGDGSKGSDQILINGKSYSPAALGRHAWALVKSAVKGLDVDVKGMVEHFILTGSPEALLEVYDAACEDRTGVSEDAALSPEEVKVLKKAVSHEYHLIMQRAHWHADHNGYKLTMPRLNSRDAPKPPTITPKKDALKAAAGERAEKEAERERAMKEHHNRRQERKLEAARRVTTSDLYLKTVDAMTVGQVDPTALVAELLAGMSGPQQASVVKYLADMSPDERKRDFALYFATPATKKRPATRKAAPKAASKAAATPAQEKATA